MLRIYFLPQWFNLSDPAAEDALYGSAAMRRFAGPYLGEALFQCVLEHRERQGIEAGKGTVVDAALVTAPPSAKNQDRSRAPDMRQTKKGNQLFRGLKARIGVDIATRVIHAVAATAANVHDETVPPVLLDGEETKVGG